MDVYVVTKPDYSSCDLIGVFSSREKAESFIGPLGKEAGYEIEERPLDGPSPLSIRRAWNAGIELDHGRVTESTFVEDGVPPGIDSDHFDVASEVQAELDKPAGELRPELTIWARSYVSPEHAVMLACQRRRAILEHRGYKSVDEWRAAWNAKRRPVPHTGKIITITKEDIIGRRE